MSVVAFGADFFDRSASTVFLFLFSLIATEKINYVEVGVFNHAFSIEISVLPKPVFVN